MEDLKQKILKLQELSKVLEPIPEVRKNLTGKVEEYTGKFIDTLSEQKTFIKGREKPGVFRIDGRKKNIDDILKLYHQEVVSKGIKAASEGHIGYIPGGGIYATSLADYLTDVTNVYTGISYASPGGVAIEYEVLNWLKDLFSFPKNAVGNLTSGGSIANLIALTAARDKYSIKSNRINNSVIYLSDQVHHCIFKALRIIGLEDILIRNIELDENSKIISTKLNEMIRADKEKGLNPFLVVASAGTTDTGAIDPLHEIADICEKENIWFHVDAAYGGFFILVDSKKELFKGIERADSLVVDPHKGLFLPYGLGAVLVRDKKSVLHSNHYVANYMQDSMEDALHDNPADLSPELTKPFRSMRLWLPLQLYGIEPFSACLEEKIWLTHYFRARLAEEGFKLGPVPDLSVSYFWYPFTKDENAFNEKLMKEIHNDGEIYLSSTTLNGKFVIRMAILSFRTKLSTIDRAVAMINRVLIKVKAQN